MRRAPELDVAEVIWNTIEPILSLPDAATRWDATTLESRIESASAGS